MSSKEPIKILNLYAGIGGNRKLWGEVMEIEVTAVEIKEEIAKIYQDLFPNDKVVIEDAHEYLKNHYEEFDFIWSSPPCPTHSRTNIMAVYSDDERTGCHKRNFRYPDMDLYQEIILLNNFYDGEWCVENVIAYYEPLIKPQEIQRHYFWANFHIPRIRLDGDNIWRGKIEDWQDRFGFDLSGYELKTRKDKILRSCVHPKLGKHILKSAFKEKQQTLKRVKPK